MKSIGTKSMNPIKSLGTKFVPVASSILGHKGQVPQSSGSSNSQGLRDIYSQDGNSVNSQNMPTGLGKR